MNHNLGQIKQDYQNINIPKDLEAQVALAITQAKEDAAGKQGQPAPKKASLFRFPFAKAAAGVAAAAFLLIILANSNASIAYAMGQIPVLGAIVQVVTFREYKHQENKMEANLKIPEIQVADSEGNIMEEATEDLSNSIQDYTTKIIAAYEADVKAAGGEGTQAVDLDYEIVTDNDKLFSLRFHQTITMAGAAQMEKIYHIDKTTGEMVTLKDLFQDGADYKTPISENIKAQMKEQMAQDESIIYWVDSDITEWNFQEIAEDVNFYINNSGKLTIVFDEYQVAPGSMGVVAFEIPTEAVSDILKDGYLL